MEFIGFVYRFGAILLAGIALACAVAGVVYLVAVSRYDRYLDFLALAGAGTDGDGDSDPDCRANLNIDRSTHPAHRGPDRPGSVVGTGGIGPVGRHDADRNPVCTDAQAVA